MASLKFGLPTAATDGQLTGTLDPNVLYAVPIDIDPGRTVTLTKVGLFSLSAGSHIHFGLCATNPNNGMAGALLADGGEVSAAAYPAFIQAALSATGGGRLWVIFNLDQAMDVAFAQGPVISLGYDFESNAPIRYLIASRAYSTGLPANFPSGFDVMSGDEAPLVILG